MSVIIYQTLSGTILKVTDVLDNPIAYEIVPALDVIEDDDDLISDEDDFSWVEELLDDEIETSLYEEDEL
jgi:hypothetical protein